MKRVALFAGILVLISFILPWMSISDWSDSETITGRQHAEGSYEYLYLIPAAGCGLIVLALLEAVRVLRQGQSSPYIFTICIISLIAIG